MGKSMKGLITRVGEALVEECKDLVSNHLECARHTDPEKLYQQLCVYASLDIVLYGLGKLGIRPKGNLEKIHPGVNTTGELTAFINTNGLIKWSETSTVCQQYHNFLLQLYEFLSTGEPGEQMFELRRNKYTLVELASQYDSLPPVQIISIIQLERLIAKKRHEMVDGVVHGLTLSTFVSRLPKLSGWGMHRKPLCPAETVSSQTEASRCVGVLARKWSFLNAVVIDVEDVEEPQANLEYEPEARTSLGNSSDQDTNQHSMNIEGEAAQNILQLLHTINEKLSNLEDNQKRLQEQQKALESTIMDYFLNDESEQKTGRQIIIFGWSELE